MDPSEGWIPRAGEYVRAPYRGLEELQVKSVRSTGVHLLGNNQYKYSGGLTNLLAPKLRPNRPIQGSNQYFTVMHYHHKYTVHLMLRVILK